VNWYCWAELSVTTTDIPQIALENDASRSALSIYSLETRWSAHFKPMLQSHYFAED
jgi:hypothetical protein